MTTPPADPSNGSPSHYFDPAPLATSDPRIVHVSLPDVSFDITTDTGVFGRHKLDPGTKILLLEAPDLPQTGRFLDLGCGAGPIALTMAQRRPDSQIVAVDVNARARSLTTDNARSLGLRNVVVLAPEDVDTSLRFDVIWSNPPIKVGKKVLHSMLTTWVPRLEPSGMAILVVHKNLGSDSLAVWCQSQGWKVKRIASRQGYRLLSITLR